MEADSLLEEATTDAEGLAVFTLDLPFGQYYVKEHKAPAGYVSSDEVLTFEADYQGQDVPVVQLGKSVGGRPSKEHRITVEMAKHICMIQRSEIGKRYRQYFLELEKAFPVLMNPLSHRICMIWQT